MCEECSATGKVIAALVPIYHSSYGNATKVMYSGGNTVIIPRTIKTVLKNIARENAVDIKACREKYGKLLGCGRASPIPLNSMTILMPLKMRRIISKNDSARGYINCLVVKGVEEAGSGVACFVILHDDRRIKCLHSKKNIKQHLGNCRFVHTLFSGVTKGNSDRATEYLSCPATKSDIAMLLKEIRELREKV